MRKQSRFTLLNLLFATFAAALLSGCSSSFAPGPVRARQVPIGNIKGSVHGGSLPVSGASIYLYQASTAGYGTAATSLICKASTDTSFAGNPCPSGTGEDGNGNYYVTTDANGDFALSGDYRCTSGDQVYAVAVGGSPGLGGTVDNTAIVQMAALGQCPSSGSMASQVPYLAINEVTTVAFAYSVSGFATTPYNVSSDALGATALANAFANVNNIVDPGSGAALTLAAGSSNGVAPQAKIYTLANILASCVNTSSSNSVPCANLFKDATSSSGTRATDEGSAIFNIVHNPALQNGQTQSVTALYNLMNGTTPFSPYLAQAPADWTLPVVYNGVMSAPGTNGGENTIVGGPYNVGFDTGGNTWMADRIKGVQVPFDARETAKALAVFAP